MESTLVMIKPNGVKDGLIGEVIGRYEKARLSIGKITLKTMSKTEAEGFYIEHQGKEFYPPLIEFMSSGPVIIMVLEGDNAIEAVRAINGATSPSDASPGTIRYDFAPDVRRNIVHSSDSPTSASREIGFWFK
jgi:nucleoside-diphosphate kinase